MQNEQVVARIKALAAERRIPLQTLYEAVGVTASAVSQWKNGKTNPAIETLNKIAAYLKTTTGYLIEGIEKPAPISESGSYQDRLLSILNQLSDTNQAQLLSYAEFLKDSERK